MSAKIRKYTVTETWGDRFEISLEVDHEKLTPERAEMHLRFWSGADEKISDENDDPVKAAIREFGTNAIYHMLGDLGAKFSGGWVAAEWSKKMRDMEGYGGEDETPYGWLGIRILSADAQSPSYDDLELKETTEAG